LEKKEGGRAGPKEGGESTRLVGASRLLQSLTLASPERKCGPPPPPCSEGHGEAPYSQSRAKSKQRDGEKRGGTKGERDGEGREGRVIPPHRNLLSDSAV
jgi:hypothetical protein